MCLCQAEEILHEAVEDVNCLDHWTAVRCLAYYGECDSYIVQALIRELFAESHADDRRLQATINHLISLSTQSVCRQFHYRPNIYLI